MMGTIFAYSIASSLLLTALYLPYKWLLSGLKQPTLNRFTLLAIYVVALCAWPLAKVLKPLAASTPAGGAGIEPGDIAVSLMEGQSGQGAAGWMDWCLPAYVAGAALTIAITIASAIKTVNVLRRCKRTEAAGTRVLVSEEKGIAPFSIFNCIVIPAVDLEEASMIVAHERVHVRRRHSLDLILAQAVAIVQWWNPAAWLMVRELKSVHEFEADAGVIDSGIDMKQYQMLLIKKAVGSRFPSPANSLNHSNLKIRIAMMYDSKSTRGRQLRGLALVPALAAALAVTNLDAVASVISDASAGSIRHLSEAKVTETSAIGQATADAAAVREDAGAAGVSYRALESGSDEAAATEQAVKGKVAAAATSESREGSDESPVLKAAEKMPQFPGGDAALFKFLMENVKYPQSAMDDNVEGRVVVRFTVSETGKVMDPVVIRSVREDLDKAALEVIGSLPDFVPGTVDNKPVAVSYTLPVSFKLSKSAGEDATNVAIFIEGKKSSRAELAAISPERVKSMTIVKDDPEFPDGKIVVELN